MYDIHCHILPKEDKCKTANSSLNHIKYAASQGVKNIILTPELDCDDNISYKKKRFKEQFKELKQLVNNEDIEIELQLGTELEAYYNLDVDIHENKLTLGESNYVLIDCKDYKGSVDALVYEIVIAGYSPVISNVANYRKVNLINRLKQWKSTGALVQVNAGAIFSNNRKTKSIARKLVRKGLVDFISSGAPCNSFKTLKKARRYVNFWNSKQYTVNVFERNAKQIFTKQNA